MFLLHPGRGANARLVDASGCPALSWTRNFKGVTASTVESPSPDAVVQAALARERAMQNAQLREDGDDGDDDRDDVSSTRLVAMERLHAGLANEVVSDDDDDE